MGIIITHCVLRSGLGEDAVKLYDLSNLCADVMEDRNSNPFTVPVGILLYRVARNMRQTVGRKKSATIRTLLEKCIQLLDDTLHSQVSLKVHENMAVSLCLWRGCKSKPSTCIATEATKRFHTTLRMLRSDVLPCTAEGNMEKMDKRITGFMLLGDNTRSDSSAVCLLTRLHCVPLQMLRV